MPSIAVHNTTPSFRGNASRKKREGKKAKLRAMAKQFWGVVKIILVILGVICAIVGITAILGCEYQMDGLKDLPICAFGKNPNNDDGDRRLLDKVKSYRYNADGKILASTKIKEYDVNTFSSLRGKYHTTRSG